MTNEQLLLAAYAKGHITRQQMEDGLMSSKAGDARAATNITPPTDTRPPLEAMGLVPHSEGHSWLAPQGKSPVSLLPSGLQPGGNPWSTVGAIGAGGAAALTGGLGATALAGMGGAMSNTPGDAAQATVLGGLSKFLPGQGPSRIMQALKGAAGGAALSGAGQEIKSGIDEHKLVNPVNSQMGIAAALGGAAGAAAKPLGQLTPAQEEAAQYQAALTKHQADTQAHTAQDRVVRKLDVDTKPMRQRALDAATAAQDAQKASKLAADNLKDQARRASTYDKNGYAARQAQYSADIHANSTATSRAQEALDDTSRELRKHEKSMAETERMVRKEDVADTMAKVDSLKGANDLSRAGYRPDLRPLSAEELEAAQLDRAKNSIQARTLARDASDTNSGVTPMDVVHKPETLTKQAELRTKEQESLEEYQTQKAAGESLRQQKLDHAAQYKGAAGGVVDPTHYTAVEDALGEAEKARATARAAREAHLDHLENLAEAEKKKIDMEPGEAPTPPTSPSASAISRLADKIPGKYGLALKIAGAVAPTPTTKPPEPPSDIMKRLQELFSGVNNGQAGVPGMLSGLSGPEDQPQQ